MSFEVAQVVRPQSRSYDTEAVARRLPEPDKKPGRGAFERDRARVLHSAALRRLGAKTQVLGPGADDYVRTRLTHSLEVAQVGRELAINLGCDPDVVETACLSHDLGHPPFGHNGERALAAVAGPCGGFEGNAQTFRLLTRLEPKVVDRQGTSYGLNLTRATLDATLKYPWAAAAAPLRADGTPSAKFGVYGDDAAAFAWVRHGVPAGQRCLEAQLMDLADDIAYCVHDVEDAFGTARATPDAVVADGDQILAATRQWYGETWSEAELADALRRLVELPAWPTGFAGSRSDLARLKNFSSAVIGRFVGQTVEATRAACGQGPLARYDASLVVPAQARAEIAVMKGIAVRYVMAPREIEPLYLSQRTLLFDLVAALQEAGWRALEAPFAADYRQADDDAGRLRAVIDQVASLSDLVAHQWHARLCGMLSSFS
ncbi:deoxyguanosinetriphosphate triphosphohydrolase [Buchananella hordeovulneris]|uniref:deoxyguanosinetriphosphate triphosphohydrolase n=1 Tax=Buchananella hordeovulneris TaxID=52770 RepID=UPI00248AE8E0|nr:deoxyguanosinetriphosphate triphosphohydrolase [Buchananella hordeovulneris]